MSINVGFELEFISDMPTKRIRNEFSKYIKRDVRGLHWEHQASGKNWALTDDPSCKVSRGEMGYEIISPVFPLDKLWPEMNKTLDFIKSINAETHRSTGVHINLDIGADTKDIDPLKLVLLLDEMNIMEKYGRERHKYCQPYANQINNVVKRYKKRRDFNFVKNSLGDIFSYDKYKTVNFMNLENRGYVEFRLIGGTAYEYMEDEIWQDILHFVDCTIYSSCDMRKGNITKKINEMIEGLV